jgi:hypothetical protein
MCEICIELDIKIDRYKRLGLQINDQLTIDRIKLLVAELEAQKVALHPKAA